MMILLINKLIYFLNDTIGIILLTFYNCLFIFYIHKDKYNTCLFFNQGGIYE